MITRNLPALVARRAKSQPRIGAHGCRDAELAARTKESQAFSLRDSSKGRRLAFRALRAVGKSAACVGATTHLPQAVDIFVFANSAARQFTDRKVRIREGAISLVALMRMNIARLSQGDGYRSTSRRSRV